MATAPKLHNIHEMYGHLDSTGTRPIGLHRRRWLRIGMEESAGWLMTGGGAAWAVNLLGNGLPLDSPALATPEEIAAVGALIWLHAKWRRFTKVD